LFGFSAYRRSHFAPAFFFLKAKNRAALQILYEVCRIVDDVADKKNDNPKVELAAWALFFREHDPRALEPFGHQLLAREFRETADVFKIPWDMMTELVEKGVGVDLERNRYQTPMDTESYCYGVAGTVGVACLPIFGVPVEEGRAYAVRLGIAVQWVNLIRDVGVDAEMNRIYLPLDHLEKFQVSEEDIITRKKNSAFDNLMRFEAGVARSHFKRAVDVYPVRWDRELRPARIMGTIYMGLLLKIEKAQFPVFDKKVRLNLLEKVLATIKGMKNY